MSLAFVLVPICFASENFRPQLAQRRLKAMEIAAKQKVCKDEGRLNAPPGPRGYGNLVQNTSRQASRQAWGCGNWSKTIYNISQRRGPFFALKRQEKADAQTWAQYLIKMRLQNQGPKTGSFAVTHGRTFKVASMLLIFSDMKLYFNIFCKENMSGVLTMFGLKM